MVKVIYYNCKKKIKILKKSLDFYKMVLYVVFRKMVFCRYSSVVEHTLGKGGVVSPILTSGTIKKASIREAFLMVW